MSTLFLSKDKNLINILHKNVMFKDTECEEKLDGLKSEKRIEEIIVS